MAYKKKFMVLPAGQQTAGKTVEAQDRKLEFGSHGAFLTSDASLARDIDQKYGKKGTGEFLVAEQPRGIIEPGHAYFFSMPGVPWKRNPSKRWVEVRPGIWKLEA